MKISSFLYLVLVTQPLFATNPCKSDLSKEVVQKNTCPGEACKLQTWMAKQVTPVFGKPKGKKIFELKTFQLFKAVNSQSFIMPRKAKAFMDKRLSRYKFAKGDEFYLMSYQGEGYSDVCFKEKLIGFDVTRVCDPNRKYPSKDMCWAELKNNGGEDWWVKIEFEGKTGWIDHKQGDYAGEYTNTMYPRLAYESLRRDAKKDSSMEVCRKQEKYRYLKIEKGTPKGCRVTESNFLYGAKTKMKSAKSKAKCEQFMAQRLKELEAKGFFCGDGK